MTGPGSIPGSTPSAFPSATVQAVASRGGVAKLVAGRAIPAPAIANDRVEISARAALSTGSLSPYRTAADRVEAATGVARGRLVDRTA